MIDENFELQKYSCNRNPWADLDINVYDGLDHPCEFSNKWDSVSRSFYFTPIYVTLLFIKRRKKITAVTHQYFTTLSIDNCDTKTIKITNGNPKVSSIFSFPCYEVDFPSGSRRFLTEAVFDFFSTTLGGETVAGFDLQYLRYNKSALTGAGLEATMTIRPVTSDYPFQFPEFESLPVVFSSIFLLVVAIVLLLVFAWYCWSVQFIIVKHKIEECAPLMTDQSQGSRVLVF